MLRRLQQAFWIALFVCFAIGFGWAVWSASGNIPSKQKSEWTGKAEKGTQPIAPSIGGTLNQSHTPENRPEAVNHKRSSDEIVLEWLRGLFDFKATDFLLVIFTAVLAFKTAGVFRETAALRSAADQQARDMQASIIEARRSADAARDAADAAKLNAQAVIETERARIYIVFDAQVTDHLVALLQNAAMVQNMDDGHVEPRPRVGIILSIKDERRLSSRKSAIRS
jgi:hypothetical protein